MPLGKNMRGRTASALSACSGACAEAAAASDAGPACWYRVSGDGGGGGGAAMGTWSGWGGGGGGLGGGDGGSAAALGGSTCMHRILAPQRHVTCAYMRIAGRAERCSTARVLDWHASIKHSAAAHSLAWRAAAAGWEAALPRAAAAAAAALRATAAAAAAAAAAMAAALSAWVLPDLAAAAAAAAAALRHWGCRAACHRKQHGLLSVR
jgi:hypothetical protein